MPKKNTPYSIFDTDKVTAGFAASQLYQGINRSALIMQTSRLNKRLSNLNAAKLELDAFEAEQFGLSRSARYVSETDAVVGAQRAALADADVDVTRGTARQIQRQSRFTSFLNQLAFQDEARNRAYGLREAAASVRLEGDIRGADAAGRAEAETSKGYFGAVSTLLSGYAFAQGGG